MHTLRRGTPPLETETYATHRPAGAGTGAGGGLPWTPYNHKPKETKQRNKQVLVGM